MSSKTIKNFWGRQIDKGKERKRGRQKYGINRCYIGNVWTPIDASLYVFNTHKHTHMHNYTDCLIPSNTYYALQPYTYGNEPTEKGDKRKPKIMSIVQCDRHSVLLSRQCMAPTLNTTKRQQCTRTLKIFSLLLHVHDSTQYVCVCVHVVCM